MIDACVLVSTRRSGHSFTIVQRRLFLSRWSDEIIAEVDHTLLKFGLSRDQVDHLVSELTKNFPDAWIEAGYKELVESMKNNEKDRHVVAAAVKAGCEVIVTYNLKHFGQEHLKPLGITARHPDNFLLMCII